MSENAIMKLKMISEILLDFCFCFMYLSTVLAYRIDVYGIRYSCVPV